LDRPSPGKVATSHQVDLAELPLAVLQTFNPSIEKDVYEVQSLRDLQIARHHARLI